MLSCYRLASGAVLTVRNPATGEVLRLLSETPPATVAELVAGARTAQAEWEARGFDGRARVLRAMRRWLLAHRDRVADALVAETGKPRDEALLTEIDYVVSALGFWARRASRSSAR